VVAKSRGACCGGCTKSAWFAVVHPQNSRVPWLSHKAKTDGSAGGDVIRARRKASRGGGHATGSRDMHRREAKLRPMGVRPMGISTS
jgi:hypothetical protein